jgi:hypothetical protein
MGYWTLCGSNSKASSGQRVENMAEVETLGDLIVEHHEENNEGPHKHIFLARLKH